MSMTFTEAVKHVLSNYAKFSGRATRSEYWWYSLFTMLLQIVFFVLAFNIHQSFGTISMLVMLALLIPSIAVSVRRLHDTDRSGWWLLITLVPLIGFIVIIIFTVQSGTEGPNRYGDPHPADARSGAAKLTQIS